MAVYEGLIPTNPAKTNHAEGPLPTDETETDQQYWTARDRDAICATATARVDDAGEGDDVDRTAAYRDQALVFSSPTPVRVVQNWSLFLMMKNGTAAVAARRFRGRHNAGVRQEPHPRICADPR